MAGRKFRGCSDRPSCLCSSCLPCRSSGGSTRGRPTAPCEEPSPRVSLFWPLALRAWCSRSGSRLRRSRRMPKRRCRRITVSWHRRPMPRRPCPIRARERPSPFWKRVPIGPPMAAPIIRPATHRSHRSPATMSARSNRCGSSAPATCLRMMRATHRRTRRSRSATRSSCVLRWVSPSASTPEAEERSGGTIPRWRTMPSPMELHAVGSPITRCPALRWTSFAQRASSGEHSMLA